MENTLLKLSSDEKLELVNQTKKRLTASLKYYQPKRDLWRKCYKIYRAIKDEKENEDEPNIGLSVAFGLVEDIVSRVASPMLGKLTIQVKPKQDDHQDQSENFFNMCRTFFGSAAFRVNWIGACKEKVVCGSEWEFDGWANDYLEGFRWGVNEVVEKASKMMPTFAAVADKMGLTSKIKTLGKVAKLFAERVGYQVEFPSIFRVHPQPGIKKVSDLGWIIETVPFISLDKLRKAKYTENGKSLPVYDLSVFDKMKKDAPKSIIKPQWPIDDEHRDFEAEYRGVDNSDVDYDEDGVHLMKVRTPNGIYVIANSTHLIQHITNPFFKPGIKARLRVYTLDPECLFGPGVIEPLIDLFEELDDVHNMAMENWIRIIHKMIIYNEEMVKYPDDFNPRSGGRVRATPGAGSIREAFLPVEQQDVTSVMITTEQNLRGYIASIASVSDMTPGTMGTKPYHTTLGGLMEMQQQFAKRFNITMFLDQAETMKQMDEMYFLYDQFMFEPLSFSRFDKGYSGAVQYTREDIDTDGKGFEFFASDDPSYGDAAILRNQWMIQTSQAMQYEQFRIAHPEGESMRRAKVDEFMEKQLEAFGNNDVTKFLEEPDGVVPPAAEWELMLKGIPVQVNPKEPLTKHYVEHFMQKMQADRAGDIPADTMTLLITHLEDTAMLISEMVRQPEAFAEDTARKQAMTASRPPMPSAPGLPGANVGQNLPAASGAAGQGTL